MQPFELLAQKPELGDTGTTHIDWLPFSVPDCSNPPTQDEIDINTAVRNLAQSAWRNDEKTFISAHNFAMVHYYLNPPLNAPCVISTLITAPYHLNQNHGLEKVRLDFNADDYFAFFDVYFPPFYDAPGAPATAELDTDSFAHGAAVFLQHTERLTLHFGSKYKYMTPWGRLDEEEWSTCRRPMICDSGKHVDWILSFAWANRYLQHIKSIKITGDVQDWVKIKWHNIFDRHAKYAAAQRKQALPVDPLATHDPDIFAIQEIGQNHSITWEPEKFYPSPCDCQIGCWRLKDGQVEAEVPLKTEWQL